MPEPRMPRVPLTSRISVSAAAASHVCRERGRQHPETHPPPSPGQKEHECNILKKTHTPRRIDPPPPTDSSGFRSSFQLDPQRAISLHMGIPPPTFYLKPYLTDWENLRAWINEEEVMVGVPTAKQMLGHSV